MLGGQLVEQFRRHGRRQVAHVLDDLGRLILTLALRTRNPSYAPPFDGGLPGSR